MFVQINTFVKNNPWNFSDLLWVMEDTPICNVGGLSHLLVKPNRSYSFYHLLLSEDCVFHSRISAIQCSKLFKEEEKSNSQQDPVIYTAVCSHHVSDINAMDNNPKRTCMHC